MPRRPLSRHRRHPSPHLLRPASQNYLPSILCKTRRPRRPPRQRRRRPRFRPSAASAAPQRPSARRARRSVDGRAGSGVDRGAHHGAERGDQRHRHRHRGGRHRLDPADAAAEGAGHHHLRRRRQPAARGAVLSRVRCLAGQRPLAGRRRLPERRAHQRGLRRRGELGRHPEQRHLVDVGGQQQPVVRFERARRRRQHPDEGRLQLPGRRGRHHGRLVRPQAGRHSGRRRERATPASMSPASGSRTTASATSPTARFGASTATSASRAPLPKCTSA